MSKQTKQEYTISEASNDDLLAIRTMHAKSWLATYPNKAKNIDYTWVEQRVSRWTTPEGLQDSIEHFKDIFNNPDHYYRIARRGGEVVGLVHGSRINNFQELQALYIDESEYGSGLAQILMEYLENWFDMNLPIILSVADYNARAIRFYEKYGYRIIPGTEQLYANKIPIIDMVRPGDRQKHPNLHPKLEIKNSPVEGKGIFTKVPIKKGENLLINIDPQPVEVHEFTDQEFDEFRKECTQKGLQWDSISLGGGMHRAAISDRDSNPENFGNHSCDPNLSGEHVALRDIAPGEELTVDYAQFSDVNWTMKCYCGSKNCKGIVKGKVK